MLATGRIQPEARLEDGAIVVLDAVIEARIQRVIQDVGNGEAVVKGASGCRIRWCAAGSQRSTCNEGGEAGSFS